MQIRLLRLTFYPLTLKTLTFTYLPIYVVRHYISNFYFPLPLCTHTFIYSDVMQHYKIDIRYRRNISPFLGYKVHLSNRFNVFYSPTFTSPVLFKHFFQDVFWCCMHGKTPQKSGATAQIGLNFSKLLELLHNYFRFFLSP